MIMQGRSGATITLTCSESACLGPRPQSAECRYQRVARP
jgi:hypothetical protein